MFSGTVNLKSQFPDIEFETIDVTSRWPAIAQISLFSNPALGMRLKVDVGQLDSIDACLKTAQDAASEIATLLTFHFGRHVAGFQLVDHALKETPDHGGQSTHHLGDNLGLVTFGVASKKLNDTDVGELKKMLAQTTVPGRLYYDLFRAAMGLGDPLSKFMALYNVVLSLCNDRQEDVDILVISVQSGVPTNPPFHPRSSGVQETVYTRLRNEVGHVRPGTTIERTRDEMATHLDGLVSVAKEVISRQP